MQKALWVLAIVACSPPRQPPSHNPPPTTAMTPAAFCAAIQTGPAAYLERCSARERELQRISEIAHGANGADQCEPRMRSLATRRIAFDASRAAGCVAAWRAQLAADPTARTLPAAKCVGVITGLVAVDGACDDDHECQGAARCQADEADGSKKKCVAAPVDEGDACTGGILPTFETDHSGCDHDMVCQAAGSRAICTKPTALGEDCDLSTVCADHGACVDKKCAAQAPIVEIGGTCATVESGELASLLPCASGAYCPIRGMKDKASCTARKRAGAECTDDDECLGRCSGETSQCESVCGSG